MQEGSHPTQQMHGVLGHGLWAHVVWQSGMSVSLTNYAIIGDSNRAQIHWYLPSDTPDCSLHLPSLSQPASPRNCSFERVPKSRSSYSSTCQNWTSMHEWAWLHLVNALSLLLKRQASWNGEAGARSQQKGCRSSWKTYLTHCYL